MTPKERRNHQVINGSRRKRIARGSGTSVQEVNQLLRQYIQARKMMKSMTAGMAGKALGGTKGKKGPKGRKGAKGKKGRGPRGFGGFRVPR
jgi:signal recognition particle subunit SRP54